MVNEVYVFISAMGSGAIAGFIYDLFRLKRKALRTKAFFVSLEDIIFWVFSAILVFITAYFSNEGEVRLYFLFGALVGVIVYYWAFSRWVIQILTFILKIIIWPFAFLVRVMKLPVKWFLALVGQETTKAEKKVQQTRLKINRRFKSIRHIMRKV